MKNLSDLVDNRVLDGKLGLGSSLDGFKDVAHDFDDWRCSSDPMREFRDFHEGLNSIRDAKIWDSTRESMKWQEATDRLLDPMREFTKQQEVTERLLDPMREFTRYEEATKRLLDPMWEFTKQQDAMKRLLDPMFGLKNSYAKLDADWKLAATMPIVVRPVSLTISKRRPRRRGQCEICSRTFEVLVDSHGACDDCAATAVYLLRDAINASRKSARRPLTVLAGGRPADCGPGKQTGRLKLVKPARNEPKGID